MPDMIGMQTIETLESRVLLSARGIHHTVSAAAGQAIPPALAVPVLPGDANSDGRVDITDLNLVVGHFNTKNNTWATGDFTGDGWTDIFDLNALLPNYGKVSTSGGTIIPAPPQPPNVTWAGPITITTGGTYTGNWQSTNANTPAVTIATTQPVTILNSNIQSRGELIVSSVSHTKLTVRGTKGWALNPNVNGRAPGRFIDVENFDSLDVENDTMVGTAGIYMAFYSGTGSGAVKILRNNALNIDGRWSNGSGGYQTGVDANELVQFAQFNQCFNMVGAEIGWNQVVNQPGLSRVEDNISVFESSGTVASPLVIHDNYIQGAYALNAAGDNTFSGGGIMLSDGATGSASTVSGNVSAFNNIVISTSNYGIAISSGHNNTAYNNTVISSGLLPGGQKIASENVGIYVWNAANDPFWGNNQEYGNTIGWMGPSGRNDSWTPDATGKTGDTALAGTVSLVQEQSYYTVWVQKVQTSGFTIGA